MDFGKNKSSCDWSSLNSSLSNPTSADLERQLKELQTKKTSDGGNDAAPEEGDDVESEEE